MYLLAAAFLTGISVFAQCPTVEISRDNWTIESVDSEETNGEGPNNGHAIHAIDGNNDTFWHTKWQNTDASFPHFISIDMGSEYDIAGIDVTTRFDSPNNKPKGYELYLSLDAVNWDPVQAAGELVYDNPGGSGAFASITFSAVTARYFKLVFSSAWDNGNHAVISEIYAHAWDGSPGCEATGQNNQVISFDAIPKHYTDDADFELNATSNSGLPVTYTVEEGPAVVNGNVVSLTGEGGTVTITASQEGNDDYYPASVSRTFEVVDLSTIAPEISTNLLDNSQIKMPALMAYRLYANAVTEEAEMLNIESITFTVDGQELDAEGEYGHFSAWWTPDSYGAHTIVMTATSSNGMQNQLQRTVTVSDEIETTTAVTLEDAIIDFGTIGSQWYYGTYELPQSVGAFDKIMAYFSVSCPAVPGGCDDWDRLAYVQIRNEKGEWIELFRYITPYGVPCSHDIDVTDYASVLQGKVDFRVYIETWGSGGWQLNLNLNYHAGTPDFAYSSVVQAWQGIYNFGDPADLQPVPPFHVVAPDNTEEATLRVVTTGHGWGQNNTGNAAEFYYAQHHFLMNGQEVFTQNMEVDCNPNPDGCTGQQGTWYYNRAGWCPGTIPAPYIYDMTQLVASPFDLEYQFQTDYVDLCHPNNPDCITGTTCPDCNDGYNPHYRIGAYIIYKSHDPLGFVNVKDIAAPESNRLTVSPNPSRGSVVLSLDRPMSDIVVEIVDVRGASLKTYFFPNASELNDSRFDLSSVPPGLYFIKAYNRTSQVVTKLILQ